MSIAYATKHGVKGHADGDAPEPGELALKLKWVRGIKSDLDDLVVRGEKFTTHFGDSNITASMTRKIVGASEVTITIADPYRRLLNKPIVAEQHELEFDGLQWLLVKVSGQGLGQPLELTYEPRVVAELKKITGPLHGRREQMTRAEFAKKLSELLPEKRRPRFISPLLHVKQPIKTQAEAKAAEATSSAERKPGLNRKGLKVKGLIPTEDQYKLGEMALEIAASHGATFKVAQALIMALIDETDMGVAAPGNVLEGEQEYTPGEGAAVSGAASEISGFLSDEPTWTGNPAIPFAAANPNAKPYEIAQHVQASGAGASSNGKDNYGQFEAEAEIWVEQFGGKEFSDTGSVSQTITKKYEFTVGKNESAWKAMVRLAGEVHWSCFESAGWIYFIDQVELLKQKTLMEIEPSNPALLNCTFDFDEGKEADEVSLEVIARAWEAPPGTAVEITGFGPADGVYLVNQITAPLVIGASTVSITLHRPHKPLKEPSAKQETKTLGGNGDEVNGVPKKVAEMIEAIDKVDAAHPAYSHAGHGESASDFAALGADTDCSGFVSQVVHAAGYLDHPLTSAQFADVFPSGAGEWVGIYGDAEHVVIKVKYPDGKWRGAATAAENGGGAGWISDEHLAEEERIRGNPCHPPGL